MSGIDVPPDIGDTQKGPLSVHVLFHHEHRAKFLWLLGVNVHLKYSIFDPVFLADPGSSFVSYCTTAETMQAFLWRALIQKELRAFTSTGAHTAGKVRISVIIRNHIGGDTDKPLTERE